MGRFACTLHYTFMPAPRGEVTLKLNRLMGLPSDVGVRGVQLTVQHGVRVISSPFVANSAGISTYGDTFRPLLWIDDTNFVDPIVITAVAQEGAWSSKIVRRDVGQIGATLI